MSMSDKIHNILVNRIVPDDLIYRIYNYDILYVPNVCENVLCCSFFVLLAGFPSLSFFSGIPK